ARKKWAEDRLRELQVAEAQQSDAENAEHRGARPVRPELECDVVELVRQRCALVDLLQGVRGAEDENELGEHEQKQPPLDLETRREPAQPACGRLKPLGHLPRLPQRDQDVHSYCGLRSISVWGL